MRFIMRRLGRLLTPSDSLHFMLLSHETLPFLLSLVLQAGTAYGKERTSYGEEQYRYHVPKNRDPTAFVPDEQRLLDYIMRGYEKAVRPVRNSSSPVIVQMGLTLTQVLDMDEKNQVLITNVWLDHVVSGPVESTKQDALFPQEPDYTANFDSLVNPPRTS